MKKILFLSLLAALLLGYSHSVLAIGLISKPLVVENAIRGEVFEDELQILNSKDEQVIFELAADGDIEEWVMFYLVDDLENSINQVVAEPRSYVKVMVNIAVPDDVANGEYSGKLTAILRPVEAKGEGSSASVSQRLSRPVSINVTGIEVIKLATSVIPHRYDLDRREPLSVRLIYDNQGNVSLAPLVDFKVYASTNEVVYNVIYPYPEETKAIKPGEIREIKEIVLSTDGFKRGEYRAELNFLHNNEVILTEDFNFNIGLRGGLVLGVSSWKINWWIIGLAFIVIVVSLFVGVFWRRKGNSKRDEKKRVRSR